MSEAYGATPPPVPQSAPPPPPSGETPINPSPVNTPSPLTNTPPERVGPPQTRGQEAVAKAFERAKVERKGPAEPKIGHNQPPEPMKREEPLDLKKRPSEQPQPTVQARDREEGGRYAARQPSQPSPNQQRGSVTAGSNQPYGQPLKRMRPDAQAEWHKAPESVRREVHRMHREYNSAFQRYRGDHEAMNGIRHYYNLAHSQGTSLPAVLNNYTGIEAKLRSDPIGGLDVIVNNLNLRTSEGRRITLQDVAYHILSQSPEQHQLVQSQNAQYALARQLQQIQYHQRALAQQQAHMQYQQRFAHTRGLVDRFAEANPRLDELGDLIERELRLGFDLPTAYRRANLLRPASGNPAAQTRTPAPQTRSSDRSISGAPDGGFANGAVRKKSADRRGSIVSAMRRVNGAS